jgi:hypothetical protein
MVRSMAGFNFELGERIEFLHQLLYSMFMEDCIGWSDLCVTFHARRISGKAKILVGYMYARHTISLRCVNIQRSEEGRQQKHPHQASMPGHVRIFMKVFTKSADKTCR